MTKRNRLLALVATPLLIILAGWSSTSALAAPITLGSLPTSGINSLECPEDCTFLQKLLPGFTLASPVDGAVVQWSLLDATPGATYKLQVASRFGVNEFTGVGTSAVAHPLGSGVETFPASLPIHNGQWVGIDIPAHGTIAVKTTPGETLTFKPPLSPEGGGQVGILVTDRQLGFTAVVQPAPTITALSARSGPLRGGNAVHISGTEFAGVNSVSFGGAPASSFHVDSGTQITAVAPGAKQPGDVPISVTTVAGTASSSYSYLADQAKRCTVPKLKGLRLKAAKRKLGSANCALGAVRRSRSKGSNLGKVVKQNPRPGTVLPAGSKVRVTLH